MTALEHDFHEAMLEIYRSAAEACNYRAKGFLGMVVELGGLATAKKPLSSSEMQSGPFQLFECGRLDLTVESLVVKDEYRELFTPGELAEAERRLATLQSSDR